METKDSKDQDILLSTGQVASMLGVSDATIRTWVDEGYIECIVLPSGHRRFDKNDIVNLVNKSRKRIADDNVLYKRKSVQEFVDGLNMMMEIIHMMQYKGESDFEIVSDIDESDNVSVTFKSSDKSMIYRMVSGRSR